MLPFSQIPQSVQFTFFTITAMPALMYFAPVPQNPESEGVTVTCGAPFDNKVVQKVVGR
jgi:hypothetical protein